MNFVALALLEACGGDDENAFWILAGMCENLELEVSLLVVSPLVDAAVSASKHAFGSLRWCRYPVASFCRAAS